MKNLIFFDVDGTLITKCNNEFIIPQSTTDALALLQKNGNLCFINSGRAMSEMDSVVQSLDVNGYICGCGTYISYNNEILLSETIPFSLGNEIIKDLSQCGIEWMLEGTNAVYFSTRPYKTHLKDFLPENNSAFASPDSCIIVSPEDAHNLVFDKFCAGILPDSNFEYFRNKYSKSLTFIDRDGGIFEIIPYGYSKATGMKFLMDYFNIPLEHTYAAGDSTNDLTMLEFAGTSIAMEESPAKVTKYADFVTDNILDDGIYNAMKHFNLI